MKLQEKILHLMYTSVHFLKKEFEIVIKDYDISEMEAKFLFHINEKENKTCDLIDFFRKHKSTITQKTKSLEEKGFLVIKNDINDRREKSVSLSEKGKKFHKEINILKEKYHKKIFKNFSIEDQNILYSLLGKLETKD